MNKEKKAMQKKRHTKESTTRRVKKGRGIRVGCEEGEINGKGAGSNPRETKAL